MSPSHHDKQVIAERNSLIERLYLDGLPSTVIGERVGMRAATVARILRERGVEMRPRGPRT